MTLSNTAGLRVAAISSIILMFIAFLVINTLVAKEGKQPTKENAQTKEDATPISVRSFEPWNFIGPQGAGAEDPTDPSQYERANGTPSCNTGLKVCQILAPEDPDSPEGSPQPDMEAEVTSGQDVEARINAVFSTQGTNETLLSYKSSL